MLNAEETREQKKCTACGQLCRPTANFCGTCGERLPDRTFCAQCGEECVQGARFCHACGASLTREDLQQGPEPQRGGDPPDSGRGRDASDPDGIEAQGVARPAVSAFLALWLRKVAGLDGPPLPEDPDGLEEPSASPGPAGAAVPHSSDRIASLGSPATVRANVYWAIVAIVAAIGGQWLLGLGRIVPALCLYAAGIALAVWAFRLNSDDAVPVAVPGTAWQLPPKWLAAILLLPLLPAVLSLTRFLVDPRHPPNSFWLLHFAGILLFIACVYFADRRLALAGARSPSRPHGERRPWKTRERLAAIAILCVGLFLRLYDLPDFPFGTWYDEADFALQAQRILQEPTYRPLFIDSIHGPAHYIYLASSLFLVLPDVTFAIRLASVLLGTLSIPAAFMAGNQLFGRGPALILAFLVAVSRWSFNFSRIGMFNIPVTLFAFLESASCCWRCAATA